MRVTGKSDSFELQSNIIVKWEARSKNTSIPCLPASLLLLIRCRWPKRTSYFGAVHIGIEGSRFAVACFDWRVFQDFISPATHRPLNYYLKLSCLLQSSKYSSVPFRPHRPGESPRRVSLELSSSPSSSLEMAPAASCKFELSTFLVSAGSFRPATDSIIHPPIGPSLRRAADPIVPNSSHALSFSRRLDAPSQTPPACAILWYPTKPRWVAELTMLIP